MRFLKFLSLVLLLVLGSFNVVSAADVVRVFTDYNVSAGRMEYEVTTDGVSEGEREVSLGGYRWVLERGGLYYAVREDSALEGVVTVDTRGHDSMESALPEAVVLNKGDIIVLSDTLGVDEVLHLVSDAGKIELPDSKWYINLEASNLGKSGLGEFTMEYVSNDLGEGKYRIKSLSGGVLPEFLRIGDRSFRVENGEVKILFYRNGVYDVEMVFGSGDIYRLKLDVKFLSVPKEKEEGEYKVTLVGLGEDGSVGEGGLSLEFNFPSRVTLNGTGQVDEYVKTVPLKLLYGPGVYEYVAFSEGGHTLEGSFEVKSIASVSRGVDTGDKDIVLGERDGLAQTGMVRKYNLPMLVGSLFIGSLVGVGFYLFRKKK